MYFTPVQIFPPNIIPVCHACFFWSRIYMSLDVAIGCPFRGPVVVVVVILNLCSFFGVDSMMLLLLPHYVRTCFILSPSIKCMKHFFYGNQGVPAVFPLVFMPRVLTHALLLLTAAIIVLLLWVRMSWRCVIGGCQNPCPRLCQAD